MFSYWKDDKVSLNFDDTAEAPPPESAVLEVVLPNLIGSNSRKNFELEHSRFQKRSLLQQQKSFLYS